MLGSLTSTIDRLFGISGDAPRDLALIEERLAALQPRIPWIYAMIVSCLIGLVVTFKLERSPPPLAVILGVLGTVRGLMWLRLRRQKFVGEAARKRFRALGVSSVLTTVGASLMIIEVVPGLRADQAQLVFVMAATCAIALAAPMAPMPASARMTYLALGLPSAVLGMVPGSERALTVAAFNLFLCIVILLYLLRIQDRLAHSC